MANPAYPEQYKFETIVEISGLWPDNNGFNYRNLSCIDMRGDPMSNGNSTFPLKEQYLRVWTRALTTFLKWDDERITRWASRYDHLLRDPNSLLYHETALRWVTPLLYSRLSFHSQDMSVRQFECELEQAICGDKREDDPALDWNLAFNAVEERLNRLGQSLETVQRELDMMNFAME